MLCQALMLFNLCVKYACGALAKLRRANCIAFVIASGAFSPERLFNLLGRQFIAEDTKGCACPPIFLLSAFNHPSTSNMLPMESPIPPSTVSRKTSPIGPGPAVRIHTSGLPSKSAAVLSM